MYIQGIIVGLLLAAGQAIWRNAAVAAEFRLSTEYLLSMKLVNFLVSPLFIIGALAYVVATMVYMGMLAKYPYSNVQGLIVTVSLVTAFVVAKVAFKENYSPANLLGIGLLLVGVWLITRR